MHFFANPKTVGLGGGDLYFQPLPDFRHPTGRLVVQRSSFDWWLVTCPHGSHGPEVPQPTPAW